jgi:pyridoxine 4-dehydrogenase
MANDTFLLANHPVRRMGYGAMQLPGPGVFGPPRDRQEGIAVLRRAVEAGVNHIDTAQFYGPDVANELIHEALHPYPEDLVIVSKVGAARSDTGEWLAAQRPEELRAGVEENLAALELEQVPVVNLRHHSETDVLLEDQLAEMNALMAEGLIGAIGLSNVDPEQYHAAAAHIAVACVQNPYNLAEREGQGVFDLCRDDGIPYVPFFPLGSAFNPAKPVLNLPAVVAAAERLGATPAQVALAWTLQAAPNVLLIAGTSSLAHLEENLAAAELELDQEAIDAIG